MTTKAAMGFLFVLGLWQAAHAANTPHAEAAEAQPTHVSVDAPRGLLATEPARSGTKTAWIRTFGHVVPDYRAVRDINAYVSGEIRQVHVRPGESVVAGAPVVSIYSPEFIATQKGHLALLKNEEQLNILREEGRLPNYLKDAKENLRWWGMTDAQITALVEKGTLASEIHLRAPASGVVTDLLVKPGTLVNAGDRTMKSFVVTGKSVARMVASGGGLWVEGYLFPDQRALVAEETPVRIELPDGSALSSAISELLPGVDGQTQRIRFRAKLKGPEEALPLGYAVDLAVQLDRDGVWVSREAIGGQGIAPRVYVETAAGKYERRSVTILDETDDEFRISDVAAGERVVTDGKAVLEGVYRLSAGVATTRNHHH